MKNLFKISLAVFCSTAINLLAQPYGENYIPHIPTSALNSVAHSILPSSEGFILASSSPMVTMGQENFSIDRTSEGGLFLANPQEFQNHYMTFVDASCSSSPAQNLDCNGVSVIHSINPSLTGQVVVAGTNNFGVFVALLNTSGVPIATTFWQWPTGAGTAATKPIVIESLSAPQSFYVAGSFGGNGVYIFHFNSALGLIAQASKIYTEPIQINDMIQSPFGANDLILVGSIYTPANGFDGLICSFSSGLAYNFSYYRDDLGVDQWFNTIRPSGNTTPYLGYVMGGYNDGATSNNGKAWFYKTNTAFTSALSSIIEGSTSPPNGAIKRIVERKNSTLVYEFYALAESFGGPVVYKLDQFGNAFGVTYPGNPDEFAYMNQNITPIDLTLSTSLTRPDLGLHIYGTDLTALPGSSHFAESTFNGLTGCNGNFNLSSIDYPLSTPSSYLGVPAGGPAFSYCGGFILSNFTYAGIAIVCGPNNTLPIGGSNAKPTNLLKTVGNENSSSLKAICAQGRTTIQFSKLMESSTLTIQSIDGKIIENQVLEEGSTELQFSTEILAPGIYIASLHNTSGDSRTKFTVSE